MYLAGDETIVEKLSAWRRSGRTLFLPSVAEGEVLSFSKWTPGQRQQTEEFLAENFVSVAFDRFLAPGESVDEVLRREGSEPGWRVVLARSELMLK